MPGLCNSRQRTARASFDVTSVSFSLRLAHKQCARPVRRAGSRAGVGWRCRTGHRQDPTGGLLQAVEIRLGNPVTGFSRTATTDASGRYVFNNLPPNPYHIVVEVQGFEKLERDVEVRTGAPITLDLTLALEGATASVDVVGHTEDLLERDPTAHTDIDQSLIERLPSNRPPVA